MGAGTNFSQRQIVSENGIVQGKLYSILDCQEIDGNKLVKLQSPWGTTEAHLWNGDWSDYSFKWTKAIQKKLKFTSIQNGVFWMSFEDLLYEFHHLIINRAFEQITSVKWHLHNLNISILGLGVGKTLETNLCLQNPFRFVHLC